ncbi:hypothetical protein DDB_G0281191 [Dictyostelium discoideum AX4]|uniref:Uncharacterized protein n=1 Tax=Dictyostelium discoideum TaxID=44689 RepID=Q54UA2_DICDI|nr:hypothetical protein DDB_G0281191 [Dictyostelium discoideum AX4]EAL66892.1 hypothetical protein DDB_G0281191 [Dictyostelium discoideum AX4]|eukprot:XP_640874.1 hypothetical protein DDB_G0281191 [Dictyostelium discoideum AX4]
MLFKSLNSIANIQNSSQKNQISGTQLIGTSQSNNNAALLTLDALVIIHPILAVYAHVDL